MLWARQLVTMVKKKERQVDDEVSAHLHCSRRCTAFFQRSCSSWAGQAMCTRRGPQCGHVPGRQAHELACNVRRMVEQVAEWQIPIFVMDCDDAAAFDHVSHHVIIDAMEALKVPPVVVTAWIREYRRVRNIRQAGRHHDTRNSSHTIGATRRPCAADLFEPALDFPATGRSGSCLW